MHRRLRDVAGTAGVMLVLFGALMTMSPEVRERVALVAESKNDQVADTRQAASKVMTASGATAVRYAGNNTYMVFFLIVAGCLFILMLRA
jgi:hypothetical protein